MQRIPQTDGSQSSRLIHGEQDTLSSQQSVLNIKIVSSL